MTIEERLAENAALVVAHLQELTNREDKDFASVLAAERYSLLLPGKRIRPTLVLECCRLLGGCDEAALPFASAVEMVHTYSLIHDDLPCMDNDDLRRGKPTCHKAFGEATALLAGDGLLTAAFGVLVGNHFVSSEIMCQAVAALSEAAGSFGMIGGQVIDLMGESVPLDIDTLLKLHQHKTGAMITVSAKLGCLAAGLSSDDPRTKMLCRYAEKIGLAFQIVDDVLDVTADLSELGKPIGSDKARGKTTFLTFYSPMDAMQKAKQITQEAKNELEQLGDAKVLSELADYLTRRKR